jgi:Flp pilus assembly protein protease CpaA
MAMIDQNFTNSSLSLTLLFVLAMAVRQDLTEQRISNVLTLLGFASALAFQAISGGTSGFLNALAVRALAWLAYFRSISARGWAPATSS